MSNGLGKMNEARRKAEASAFARIVRERSRGNATGAHGDKRTKRVKTRNAKLAFSLKEWR
jgi:hypothetical protein